MTDFSTKNAAMQLGVSQRQVQRLVSSGQLSAKRTVGGALIVDPLGVNARERHNQSAGRPWSAEVTWGALWLVSGLGSAHLTYTHERRMQQRLRDMTPTLWLAQTRNRAEVQRLRATPSALAQLQNELALTGASAAEGFGLASTTTTVDGYCSASRRDELVQRLALIADDRGTATIRVPRVDWVVDARRTMPDAVVATDLATSFEVRERSAGERALQKLLVRARRTLSPR